MLKGVIMPQAPRTAREFLDVLARSGLVTPLELQALLMEPLPDSAESLSQLLCGRELLTPFQASQLLKGKWRNFILGHYKVLRPIASGGMGKVLLARHTAMGRLVALKILAPAQQPDASAIRRFFREGRALAALDHPNIVRAYDMGQHESLFYLALEYVEGESLGQVVRRRGALPVAEAADYVRQAALGLAHAHEAGWVHRDVKPDNLLLNPAGTVKLLDLGLARSLLDPGDDLIQAQQGGEIVGTLDFLSPEQIQPGGEVDARSDTYSLGATLYVLLTGGPPFGVGVVAQKLLWHLVADVRPVQASREDVPEEMSGLLHRMLAKDPRERPSVVDVARTLERMAYPPFDRTAEPVSRSGLAPAPTQAQPVTRTRPRRRRSLLLACAGAGVVLVAVLVTVALWRPSAPETPLSPDEAAARIGSEVVVEMGVLSARPDKGGRLVFLNSHRHFDDPKNFTIVIPREALGVGESPEVVADRYRFRRVRVRGTVTLYKGSAQVRVSSLEQIQLLTDVPGQ